MKMYVIYGGTKNGEAMKFKIYYYSRSSTFYFRCQSSAKIFSIG